MGYVNRKSAVKERIVLTIKPDVEYLGKNLESMKTSAQIESSYYMEKTRLEKLIMYAGRMGYEKLGIAFCIGLDKLSSDDYKAICNPICQALVLNKEQTDLNIILGLCIGHDILFTKHSQAPVTTLAVKDRGLAHNPLGAIYSNYYLEHRFNIKDEDLKNSS